MHKSLRLFGPARNQLWRTVRNPLADRPQVPCWHLLFHLLHIGVTDAYRIDRRQARTVRVLGGPSVSAMSQLNQCADALIPV